MRCGLAGERPTLQHVAHAPKKTQESSLRMALELQKLARGSATKANSLKPGPC